MFTKDWTLFGHWIRQRSNFLLFKKRHISHFFVCSHICLTCGFFILAFVDFEGVPPSQQTVIYFKALANTGESESIHHKFLLVSNLLNEFWSNADLEKGAYFISRLWLWFNWDVDSDVYGLIYDIKMLYSNNFETKVLYCRMSAT